MANFFDTHYKPNLYVGALLTVVQFSPFYVSRNITIAMCWLWYAWRATTTRKNKAYLPAALKLMTTAFLGIFAAYQCSNYRIDIGFAEPAISSCTGLLFLGILFRQSPKLTRIAEFGCHLYVIAVLIYHGTLAFALPEYRAVNIAMAINFVSFALYIRTDLFKEDTNPPNDGGGGSKKKDKKPIWRRSGGLQPT